MKLNDAILGLVVLFGGLAIILQARTFPPTHGQVYGPDLFPTIIGVGFVVSGIVLVASGWRQRRLVGWVELRGASVNELVDGGLVLAFILAFVLFADHLGFILMAGLGTWLLMVRFQGGRWLWSLAVTMVFIVVVDWVFRAVLLVPLPQGVFLPRLPW